MSKSHTFAKVAFVRSLFTLSLLWFLLRFQPAPAATVVTATITFTNAANLVTAAGTNATITVNSDVRTWTNTITSAATQIPLTTISGTNIAQQVQNFLVHVASYPLTSITPTSDGATYVSLRGASDVAMDVSLSQTNWGVVTYVTNTIGTAYTLRLPITVESVANRTILADYLVDALALATTPITPTTDAELLSGDTLATNVLTSSLTSLGALTNLTVTNLTAISTITGSISGSAATVSDAAITLAKMANLAQDQFIGRTTASTGVPETATITAAARTVLDDTTVSAMVDTLGGTAATGTGAIVRASAPTLAGLTLSGATDFGANTIANFKSSVNAQTGTTYTIVAGDCGKVITASNAAAITVTFTTAFPDGCSASVLQLGAGQVTIAVTGLTIRSKLGHTKTSGQYAAITLLRIGTDLWLTGDGE